MSSLPLLLANKPEAFAELREQLLDCKEAFDLVEKSIALREGCITSEEWVQECMKLDYTTDENLLQQYRKILAQYRQH